MRETGQEIPEEYTHMDSSEQKPAEEPKIGRRDFLRKLGKGAVGIAASAALGETLSAASVEQSVENKEEVELRREWEQLKKEIKSSNVRDDIAYAERAFGEHAQVLVFKLKDDLILIDQLIKQEAEGKNIFSENGLVKSAVSEYRQFWSEETFAKNAREAYVNSEQLKISGFEKTKIGNEGLQKALAKHDPRWVKGNISAVEYTDKDEERQAYKVAGQAFGAGLSGVFYKSGEESIKIHRSQSTETQEDFEVVLSHEIAHHHDWQNTNALTLPERLEFVRDITERVGAKDSFHSAYVEVDVANEFEPMGPAVVKYRQAREYWAVINERYDNYGPMLKKIQPKDFDLVEKWRGKIIERYGNK
jgi:hypothetical protein